MKQSLAFVASTGEVVEFECTSVQEGEIRAGLGSSVGKAAAARFDEALSSLRPALADFQKAYRDVADEVCIDVGVKLSSKGGLPALASVEGAVDFRIGLKWKRNEPVSR